MKTQKLESKRHKLKTLDEIGHQSERSDRARSLTGEMKPNLAKHETLKCALRLRKTSLADVARSLDVSAGSVTAVSQGHRRSRRIEAALAEAIGTTADELFSDRKQGREKMD